MGSSNFLNGKLAKIERFGCCPTICIRGNGRNNLSLGITDCAVQGYDILGCGNFIYCTCQAFHFIHGLVDTFVFTDGGEYLTGLFNGDRAFLCDIGLDYGYNIGRAVHLECYRIAVEYITIAGVLLDDFIISVRKRSREH